MVPCYSCDHQQSSLPCSNSEHSSSASCHTDTSCRSCERPEAVCDGSVPKLAKLPNVGPGKSMIPNTYNNQLKQVSKIKSIAFYSGRSLRIQKKSSFKKTIFFSNSYEV